MKFSVKSKMQIQIRNLIDIKENYKSQNQIEKIEQKSIISNINKIKNREGESFSRDVRVNILKNVLKNRQINEESLKELIEYKKKLHSMQKKDWLIKILGYPKDIPYCISPWGNQKKNITKYQLTNEFAYLYIKNLYSAYLNIKNNGYMSRKYGYMKYAMLINSKGDQRFIVDQGHKRTCALICLNINEFEVKVMPIIYENNVDKWVNVANGLYSKNEAIQFFNYFFIT